MPVLTKESIISMIRSLGLTPAERDNWYRVVRVYN